LPRNYQLSDQVQHSVMASKTAYWSWSKLLDAGTQFNTSSRTSYYQCSLFSDKKSIYPNFLLIRMARRPN